MTSECTKTLIMGFTSKPEQAVEDTRDRIFLVFFCQREDILRYFIGLISDFKSTQDITKQRGLFLAFFHRFLAPLNQPKC